MIKKYNNTCMKFVVLFMVAVGLLAMLRLMFWTKKVADRIDRKTKKKPRK